MFGEIVKAVKFKLLINSNVDSGGKKSDAPVFGNCSKNGRSLYA